MVNQYPFDFSNIMEHQSQMQDIVNNNKTALTKSIDIVNDEVDSKKRMALLTYSQNKRMTEYNKMMIIIIIGIIFSIGIYSLGLTFTIIPDIIIGFFIVIISSISLIWSYYIFSDVNSRSRVNFDEIHMDPMPSSSNNANPNDGNMLNQLALGDCIGQACCSADTLWSPSTYKCENKPVCEDDESPAWDGTEYICETIEPFASKKCVEGMNDGEKGTLLDMVAKHEQDTNKMDVKLKSTNEQIEGVNLKSQYIDERVTDFDAKLAEFDTVYNNKIKSFENIFKIKSENLNKLAIDNETNLTKLFDNKQSEFNTNVVGVIDEFKSEVSESMVKYANTLVKLNQTESSIKVLLDRIDNISSTNSALSNLSNETFTTLKYSKYVK